MPRGAMPRDRSEGLQLGGITGALPKGKVFEGLRDLRADRDGGKGKAVTTLSKVRYLT